MWTVQYLNWYGNEIVVANRKALPIKCTLHLYSKKWDCNCVSTITMYQTIYKLMIALLVSFLPHLPTRHPPDTPPTRAQFWVTCYRGRINTGHLLSTVASSGRHKVYPAPCRVDDLTTHQPNKATLYIRLIHCILYIKLIFCEKSQFAVRSTVTLWYSMAIYNCNAEIILKRQNITYKE